MVIICFSDYPIQSAKEVTKRFMELPRLPDFVKGRGNYVYSTTGEGYHNLSILEVDDNKVKEAYDAVMKAYLNKERRKYHVCTVYHSSSKSR